MAENDTLKRMESILCKEYLGFQPTSNSVKPPHIANGLFRRCTGETCDISDVHEWLVSERKEKAIPSDDLVNKYSSLLWKGKKENPNNIKEIRFLLEEIFNQANTIYPSYKDSVFTITSHWLIKHKVPAEVDLGDFLFELLAKKINGQRSPIIELIQKTLSKEDDLTKLIKPIITFPSESEKRNLEEVEYPQDDDIEWNDCKQMLRRGFDNLANNILNTHMDDNSLLVLSRIVNFAGFAAFVYLVDCRSAIYGDERVPILIDAGTGLESIKKASEQCYIASKKAVENLFISMILRYLKTEIPNNTTEDCNNWLEGMTYSVEANKKKEKNIERKERIPFAIKSYFNSFIREGESPINALAHSLQVVIYTFDYQNNTPSDFCRVLGVRCGLIGPKGNSATLKRFLINNYTLETIILSVLSEEDLGGIELKDLGTKALSTYNLILGTNADKEYEILQRAFIAQNTPGDLRGDLTINADRIADALIIQGLAKKYADGVTLVGWGLK